jgi:predicted ATPase
MAADKNDVVGHGRGFAVRWQNFRSFEDTKWVTLKPLTLLLGPNSAGKSSFIAPLLLLKQSFYSRTGSNALLTRGEYLNVGVFEDFVLGHDRDLEVSMGLRWHSHQSDKNTKPVGRYAPGGVVVSFRQGKDPQAVELSRYRAEDSFRRAMLVRAIKDDGSYSTRMCRPSRSTPTKARSSKTERAARDAMHEAILKGRPLDFLFRSRSVRQAGIEALVELDEPKFAASIDDPRARLYSEITDFTEWEVRSLLDRIHYIGPLRQEPRRVYELSGEMPAEVGTHGEFAPEIVYRWRKDKRRMGVVQKWLRHFGFHEELDFKAVGKSGFSLMVVKDGAPVASTFVDTGFGMSQVLPLIVQGLLADPGDWLIVEQPEIHLNPRLQAALADLLAEIVNRDVNMVIESHSEHMLLRIRNMVAQRKLNKEDVGLYFVEQEDGSSRVREVPVQAGGFIDPRDWPKGFFEDSLREAMELAHEQAKHRRRQAAEERKARREAQAVEQAG